MWKTIKKAANAVYNYFFGNSAEKAKQEGIYTPQSKPVHAMSNTSQSIQEAVKKFQAVRDKIANHKAKLPTNSMIARAEYNLKYYELFLELASAKKEIYVIKHGHDPSKSGSLKELDLEIQKQTEAVQEAKLVLKRMKSGAIKYQKNRLKLAKAKLVLQLKQPRIIAQFKSKDAETGAKLLQLLIKNKGLDMTLESFLDSEEAKPLKKFDVYKNIAGDLEFQQALDSAPEVPTHRLG